ncbi:MAG: alginate export family protein [Mariprofundaceae bacterium]|nr:alginate export family protein [Mariprofundaceae bacterium]
MNKTGFVKSLSLSAIALLLGSTLAQAVEVDVGGSIRPRVEYADEGIQGMVAGQKKSHTTMQTRINVKATVDENVSAFVQIQDVRTWGGETPTTAPPSITQTGTSTAGQLDLHEAYLTVKNVMDSGATLKIGRQEMVFDEARLIGNIGWIQQAQAFDAIRGDMKVGEIALTAFYAQTLAKDSHPTLGSTLGANAGTFESSFSGLRATYSLGDRGDRITPYVYYALNPSRTGAGVDLVPDQALNIVYTGLYVAKHIGDVRLRFDGAYESGKANATTNINAYMLTGAIETDLDIGNGANVALWVDYLSGDDGAAANANKVSNFTTPYATNHKFYGHMDKFLNNPTHGLIDFALRTNFKVTSKLKFELDGHMFRADKSTATLLDKDLGSEIDFDINYALATNTSLRMGYSHYFGNGTVNGGTTGNTTLDSNWAWTQVQTKF